MRVSLIVFSFLFMGVIAREPARACSPDAVFDVRILPSRVVAISGGSKSVAGVVACLADYDASTGRFFEMRLVDVDEEVGETSGPGNPLGDDVMARADVSGADPGTTDPLAVVGGRVFQVACDANGVMLATGSEGLAANPADLALHIADDVNVFRAAPNGMVVPGVCAFQEDVPAAISIVFTGQPGLPRFPELPPSMDLGYGAKFRTTSGGEHLEFITAAGGPLPEAVQVDVVRPLSVAIEGNPGQEAPLALTVRGDGSFVDVTGTVTMDGVVEAAGRGTVAGFSNIDVTLTGTLRGGMFDGEYSMGTSGGLPGGFPIVFALEGESEEFSAFWAATGEGLLGIADAMASFNSPAPTGGMDLEDALTRQAANLAIAQSALVHVPQSGIAEAAFAGVGERLDELAVDVESSRLVGATPAAAGLRAAAGSARESGAKFGELRRMPPGEALNEQLAALLGSMEALEEGLRSAEQGAFGNGLLASVSAASFAGGPVALDGIVSGFGDLGAVEGIAGVVPLPTELGGLALSLSDAAGTDHQLGLFFSSTGQVNYLMPAEAALGWALLTATIDGAVVAAGPVELVRVAPSVFTANANGSGPPAAVVLRIAPDGTRTLQNAFAGTAGSFEAAVIDLSDGAEYYLLLFGTGFRHAADVTARIGDRAAVPVPFAASTEFVGLDQANVPLKAELAGAGAATLTLVADGSSANAVELSFR